MNRPVNIGKRAIDAEEYLAPGHRACLGCGEAVAVRLILKATGPNVIVVNATGCLEVISSQLPWSSWRVPWIHTIFENAAAVASGISAGLEMLARKGRPVSKDTKVVAMAGDGATADIGLQALSGAMERGHDFLYICLDNEAYMNTGIQRSSATPWGAATTTSPVGKVSPGQTTWKKDMPAIAVAHRIPYVATATPSLPFDFMEKVRMGMAVKGPAYIHVLAVCPTGWRIGSQETVEMGRLAVETGLFPLYEVEEGHYHLTHMPVKLRPVSDYLKRQGRFRHLDDAQMALIEEKVSADYERLKSLAGVSG